ncbi:MAG TPA: maltose ABC transporter permease MalG [Myxococcaceae bacterium]|nr:maltose ABC transporter permease MalG [Myxococcaceae bacterium]
MAIVQGKGHGWRLAAAHAGLVAVCLVVLFPLLLVVSISLRPGNFATGDLLPRQITLEHWRLALGLPVLNPDGTVTPPPFPVLRWLWNSVKIAGLSALLSVVMSTTAAFAFARMRFRGKDALLGSMLLLQMFPPVLALVGIFAIFHTLGSYVPALGVESHLAVILAYVGGIALHIWTIRSYFFTIPAEIEECAKVDGATHAQAFLYILLPMAVPILMVVFVLAFIGGMIEYPIASILLRQVAHLTLAVGSRYYLYEQKYLWGDFAAAAVLSGLPITAVFLLSQRWIVSGLTAGGVKG